jgi:hypothetical protein
MELETLSDKNLNELERLSRDLLAAIRKAKLSDSTLVNLLSTLERQAGEIRRARFDAGDSQYNGY